MIEVHDITSRTDWEQWRKQSVGASEIACVLGVSPFATPFQLWCRKRGHVGPMADNAMLRRGRLMEPSMVAWLAQEHEMNVCNPRKWYLDTDERISATPDAFYWAKSGAPIGNGLVEFKVVAEPEFRKHWIDEAGDVVAPIHYRLQALAGAKLTGAVEAKIGVWVVSSYGLETHLIDVELHDAAWQKCKSAVEAWWERADKGLAPEPDYSLDGDAIKAMYRNGNGAVIDLTGNNRVPALLDELQGVEALIKSYNADSKLTVERAEAIKAELKMILGDAECGTLPGACIAWKTISKKAIPASTYRKFSWKRRGE